MHSPDTQLCWVVKIRELRPYTHAGLTAFGQLRQKSSGDRWLQARGSNQAFDIRMPRLPDTASTALNPSLSDVHIKVNP